MESGLLGMLWGAEGPVDLGVVSDRALQPGSADAVQARFLITSPRSFSCLGT